MDFQTRLQLAKLSPATRLQAMGEAWQVGKFTYFALLIGSVSASVLSNYLDGPTWITSLAYLLAIFGGALTTRQNLKRIVDRLTREEEARQKSAAPDLRPSGLDGGSRV